jgi:hypothetical protein
VFSINIFFEMGDIHAIDGVFSCNHEPVLFVKVKIPESIGWRIQRPFSGFGKLALDELHRSLADPLVFSGSSHFLTAR